MKRHLIFLLVSMLYISVLPAMAADRSSALPPPTNVQDTPEARETVQSSSNGHPLGKQFTTPDGDKDVQVRIFKRKNGAVVKEYSLNGHVYMVKISPVTGTPPYYLYDNNGDGKFEKRMPGGYRDIVPPEWVIQRF